MNGVVELEIWRFLLIYLLLVIVAFIMRKCRIDRMKLLAAASVKMTVQLILAGLILTYIFKYPHPVFTLSYLLIMIIFSVQRTLSVNRGISGRFKLVITMSIIFSGIFVILFFIIVVAGQSFFDPQYVIPISGMIMGNTMTGVSLGVKTFRESMAGQRAKINALLCVGADPEKILLPFVKNALETAMLPTLNSMLGMGIVSLPGMMTGQILAGTMPMAAILYQIAIMAAICAAVTCSSFGALYLGYKTLYDKKTLIIDTGGIVQHTQKRP